MAEEHSNIVDTCFAVLAVGGDSEKPRFLGTSFVIHADGGLLTCRHVAESVNDGEQLAVVHFDNRGNTKETALIVVDESSIPPTRNSTWLTYRGRRV